jgi:hypothetical protein
VPSGMALTEQQILSVVDALKQVFGTAQG